MLKRFTSHTVKALAEASLVALLIVGLLAGTAFAARGGGGMPGGGTTTGGGSLALVIVVDNNGDGAPNQGDTVTFDVTTSASRPFVSVKCHQGGTMVYGASAGFYADYPWSKNFGLETTTWTSGGADCTATLYTTKDGTRLNVLATLGFYAAD